MISSVRRHVNRQTLTLGTIALCVAILLATTRWLTEERIHYNQLQSQQSVLTDLLAETGYDNNPFNDTITLNDSQRTRVYRARLENRTVAVILETATYDGYNGRIDLLVAARPDGTISGVRVIRHRETPGLGDDIEHNKSRWIYGFENTSLNRPPQHQWHVKRDGGYFDQITGATITPRAVVAAVREALELLRANYAIVFATQDHN